MIENIHEITYSSEAAFSSKRIDILIKSMVVNLLKFLFRRNKSSIIVFLISYAIKLYKLSINVIFYFIFIFRMLYNGDQVAANRLQYSSTLLSISSCFQ